MEIGHYSEVLSFLRSNTPRANWTSEQRQFYKRTYCLDKKGNLCDNRTGEPVTLLEDQIPRPPAAIEVRTPINSYAAYKYGKMNPNLSKTEQYRNANNKSPMETSRNANNKSPMESSRSPTRSRSPSYNLFSSLSSEGANGSASERDNVIKPYVYQPMMKSRIRPESEFLESQKEKDKLYVYQPRGLSRSRLSSEDRDIPSSSSDSQRLKEDILEGDRMNRRHSDEGYEREERESSVSSTAYSIRSSTPTQNVKYNSPEEEVDGLRSLVRQQKRQIAELESKMRQLQSNMQMMLESKAASEEVAKNRRNEAELEIKQLKETIRNAKDTALADCKRQLAHCNAKLLAAESDLDTEAQHHSEAYRKSQNELLLTRGDLAVALEESEQRRIELEKETEKLRKVETDMKNQSEQITRLEAFVAQLKLKLSINIQTVVEQEAKMTTNEAKLAAQKTIVQELQAKIGAKDAAIQTMRKKLFDAMQLLPLDLEAPHKLRTIFENEMESALPDIVDITLKNGTYFADNQRRSRAKVEAALRLCEEIEELEASNEQLLQEYEEAIGENEDKIAIVALTTVTNDSSSSNWDAPSSCEALDSFETAGADAKLEFVAKLPLEIKLNKEKENGTPEKIMKPEYLLPEEKALTKNASSAPDLDDVKQSCETPKRVSFLEPKEVLLQEKQEKLCDTARKMDSLVDSSPPVQISNTEATILPESIEQQRQENDLSSQTAPINVPMNNTEATKLPAAIEHQQQEKDLCSQTTPIDARVNKAEAITLPASTEQQRQENDRCSKTAPIDVPMNNTEATTLLEFIQHHGQENDLCSETASIDVRINKADAPTLPASTERQQQENDRCSNTAPTDAHMNNIEATTLPKSTEQEQRHENDRSNQTSPKNIEPSSTIQDSSIQDAKENCDKATVVDENASVVANAVADAIADAHANANAIIEQLVNEKPPEPTAKDEQLAQSMKKLESLRQRLNQKKAANQAKKE